MPPAHSYFRAKTSNGYYIKILVEMLQSIICEVPLILSPRGIEFCVFDEHELMAINLNLRYDKFDEFVSTQTQTVGVNLKNLHSMLKNTKKKASITFFIDPDPTSEHYGYLEVTVTPNTTSGKTSITYLRIQIVMSLPIELPTNYGTADIIKTAEYKDACRDMKSTGSIITLIATRESIHFLCKGADDLFIREDTFPRMNRVEYLGGDDEADRVRERVKKKGKAACDANKHIFKEDFTTKLFGFMSKSIGLAKNMQLYISPNEPLKFEMDVGNLGQLEVYMKSNRQVEEELLAQQEAEQEVDDDPAFSDAMSKVLEGITDDISEMVPKKMKPSSKKAAAPPPLKKKSVAKSTPKKVVRKLATKPPPLKKKVVRKG
jgi:hypothetical protein